MAVLLVVEAATFGVAASIHHGARVFGLAERFDRAALPEAIIAGILVVGAIGASRGSWRAALIATVLAVVGTCIGVATIIGGVGPQTAPDVVYHVTILVGLVGSAAALLRPGARRAFMD